jgi:hypothetical protein
VPTKVSPERPGHIYVLTDPRTNEIQYLGITSLSIERRLSMHKSSVTGGKKSEVYEWIRELRELGMEPQVHLVEDCTDPQREVYWIALLHDVGVQLRNMDDGGTGKGKKLRADHARKIGEGHIGIKRTLESRLKQVRSRQRASTVKNTGGDRPMPSWEDVNPEADTTTEVARVTPPLTGSVLGQNFSRLRDIAQRIAAHDEARELPIIEGEVPHAIG